MSFTGDFIDASTALAWGLVVEVVTHDHLLPRARELAAAVVSIPSENVREVRRMYEDVARCPASRRGRRSGMGAPVDGRPLRPVPPGRRARGHHGPRPRPGRGGPDTRPPGDVPG